MKRQVRCGVFETNSSSTHSLTMCSEQQYEDWKAGKILFNCWNDKFVDNYQLTTSQMADAERDYENEKLKYWKDWKDLSDEEKNDYYVHYAIKYGLKSSGCQTFKEWNEDYSLETFVDRYTSESGDKIVAFGKYGYDG